MLKTICLELYSACNLRCKMCPCTGDFTGARLPDATIERIFEDVARYNGQADAGDRICGLRFDGNTETLLVKDVPEYIAAFKKRNADLSASAVTNGVLLDADMSQRLIDAGLNHIQISVTGMTPEVYRGFQGYGMSRKRLAETFASVNQNAQRFLRLRDSAKNRPHVAMSYIVTEESIGDMYAYWRHWSDLDAEPAFRFCWPADATESYDDAARPNVIAYRRCASMGQLVVKSNGDILFSCCARKVPVIGNAMKDSLFDFLVSQRFRDMESAVDCLSPDRLPAVCASCPALCVYERGLDERYDKAVKRGRQTCAFDNSDFSNNTLSAFYERLAGRKLAVFGADANIHFMLKAIDKRVEVFLLVDNDKRRCGVVSDGLRTESPEALGRAENKDDIVVLITQNGFSEAGRQLEALGFHNYFAAKLFPETYGATERRESE
jgi:MoaA/NifB/PqqE/SkfB family radical SAM enzyme